MRSESTSRGAARGRRLPKRIRHVAGKADWLGMGMPSEGAMADSTIKRIVRDVPACTLEDSAADVKARLANDWDMVVVLDGRRIVLGLLQTPAADESGKAIEDLMKPAPLTLRPSLSIDEAIDYFNESDKTFALVTKSNGELIGAIRKSDLTTRSQK